MKKKNRLLVIFVLLCCLLPAYGAAAGEITDGPAAGNEPQSEIQSETQSAVKTGLVKKKNGKLYYYNSSGTMVKKRWKTVNGKRYYFTKTGAAAVGPVKIKKKLYLFGSNGALKEKGFRKYEGKTYYVNAKGEIQTGWKKIQKKKYYFDSKGVMQKKTWVDGRYLGKDGAYDPDKKELAKLKKKMESAIRSYKGTWSIYVENLKTGEKFSINNQKMYAASLIKLYAMGAVYKRIAQGKIKESSVKKTISNMITVSDNTAFNTIVKKVGTTYINKWCKDNGYKKTNQGHGLSPSSNNYGLSNGTGSNVTSVADCGKFLESVYRGKCVSSSASKKMLGYLKKQQRRWKIPAGVPKGVTVANKTGETNDYTHDAAIVWSKGAVYILVVMAKTPGSGWSSASHIVSLSRMTYNYFNP